MMGFSRFGMVRDQELIGRDALRHGNLAGSHPLGGVLTLMGDDHTGSPQQHFTKVNSQWSTL